MLSNRRASDENVSASAWTCPVCTPSAQAAVSVSRKPPVSAGVPETGHHLNRDAGPGGDFEQVAQLSGREFTGHVAQAGQAYQEMGPGRRVAEQDKLLAGHPVRDSVIGLVLRGVRAQADLGARVALHLEKPVYDRR